MANLPNFKQVSISQMLGDLSIYKYDPSRIQQVTLKYLSAITDGAVDIVDPTNPFVFLMEMSSVHTALAINENEAFLRKQYPSLSLNKDDLYIHMSDKDYINRFALPSTATFKVLCDVTGLINNMEDDPDRKQYKVTIPRDTTITASGINFSIVNPVNIIKQYTGSLRVEYDTSYPSPLFDITTSIIQHEIITDKTNRQWLIFNLPTYQFDVSAAFFNIENTNIFNKNVTFKDQFYFARVFYSNNTSNGNWVEIKTTHSEQVFDPLIPTAIINVLDDEVRVTIPYVYVLNGNISGNVRVDIYTTKGDVELNLSQISNSSFTINYSAINKVRDSNKYTQAIYKVPIIISSTDFAQGGKNSKDFIELRSEVLDNAIGNFKLPITHIQMVNYLNDRNYTVSKNVDTVTERYYIASKDLTNPKNSTLITPAVVTGNTVITTMQDLQANKNLYSNLTRVTIPSNSLFKVIDGKCTLLSDKEVYNLQVLKTANSLSFTNLINNGEYFFTPYYYVVDFNSSYFEVRPYNLDSPVLNNINFKYRSSSYLGAVNTKGFNIKKTNDGYVIQITTKQDNTYKEESDDNLFVQLSYIPVNGSTRAYLNGNYLGKAEDGSRIFEFTLKTNHQVYPIENNHYLELTNFGLNKNTIIDTQVSLNQIFDITYLSKNKPENFVLDYDPLLVDHSMTSDNAFVITHETFNITLGQYLKYLWSKSRTFFYGNEYKTYKEDIPLYYTEDIYETDLETGSIFKFNSNCEIEYLLKYKKGDPILDTSGNQVYSHRKGDPILDENQQPIKNESIINRLFYVTLVDACYLFADGNVYNDYRKDFTAVINDWVVDEMVDFNEIALEKTAIYYYPKITKGKIKVLIRDKIYDYIEASQKLILDFYVPNNVYNDVVTLDYIKKSSISLIGEYFKNKRISISDMVDIIKTNLNNTIVSVSIKNLGGENNYEVVTVDETSQLSIAKKLTVIDSGDMIVEEDITFNFFIHELPL